MAPKVLVFIFILFLSSCKQVQKLSDVFVPPSPREAYARNFEENDTIFKQWDASFELALNDSLKVELPYVEVGRFTGNDFPTYGYTMNLGHGEKVIVSLTSDSDSIPVFINIHNSHTPDSLEVKPLLETKRFGRLPVELPIEKTGIYSILIQPEANQIADFKLEIYTLPTLGFPVAGYSTDAIQSFWGAPRSGGTRSHKGVDIFAPRLTPALAVTDGRISYTGERGLGGKQVWLKEGVFRKSFYYAHLDSINVSTTNKVMKGDTLGFVGNTGNARNTLPHLHFGIYTGNGAIDPLPFIRKIERKEIDLKRPFAKGYVSTRLANVRLGPNIKFEKIMSLNFNDSISIMGKTLDWYHIKTTDNISGFIHETLVKEYSDEQGDETGL